MDAEQAIFARRSVRKYREDAVAESLLDKLMQYAMAAPSACNKKPWEFYVVTAPDLLARLRKATRFSNITAPAAVIAAGNRKHMLPLGGADFWIQDCSAAVENILVGAAGQGLGTCWCGVWPSEKNAEKIREILDAPKEIVPLGLIWVGWPAEAPEPRTQYDPERVHRIG